MRNLLFALSLSFSAYAQEASSGKFEVMRGPDQVEDSSDGQSRIRTKRITHPAAKEGLYLIDEEGVYHYKVKTISKKDNSLFMRFISQSAPVISTENGLGQTITFEDMYDAPNLMGLDFVYEWQPFKQFGKLGMQLGAAFSTANGKGYFLNKDKNAERARESYTFISLPISVGGVYRFEYGERQWVAPYVAGGVLYNGLIEWRNDSKFTTVGTPGIYGAGGLLFNLTAMSKDLAFKMDREYGFSQLWIVAEYKRIQALSKDLDISSNQIGVGLGADY